MCVTTLDAELSQTIIGLWDIDHPELGRRRVLAYQNTPKNRSERANCMLLHVPAASPLTPQSIINTEADPDFLEKMAARTVPVARGAMFGTRTNFVVEMGIYHIAVLNDPLAQDVEAVLASIPESKRPELRPEIRSFYAEQYPGFALVLCCFNNREAKKASPILLHYSPSHPHEFHFPTLESHGSIPRISEMVNYHQKLILGTDQPKVGQLKVNAFDHSDCSEQLQAFLPAYGAGLRLDGEMPNSDVVVPLAKLPEHYEMYGELYHHRVAG